MSIFSLLFGKTGTAISVVELKEKMSKKSADVFYLDVRTPMEYKSNGLKGFTNISVDQLSGNLHRIPKEKEIVVICQSGSRSSSAARLLSKNGYERVTNVRGGMGAWMMHRL